MERGEKWKEINMPVYSVDMAKRRKKKGNGVSAKKRAERIHCQNRSEERFGVNFDSKTRVAVVKAIQSGKGVMVKKQSNRVTVWKNVVPEHPEIIVVYDKKRKEAVTVLKEGWAV